MYQNFNFFFAKIMRKNCNCMFDCFTPYFEKPYTILDESTPLFANSIGIVFV